MQTPKSVNDTIPMLICYSRFEIVSRVPIQQKINNRLNVTIIAIHNSNLRPLRIEAHTYQRTAHEYGLRGKVNYQANPQTFLNIAKPLKRLNTMDNDFPNAFFASRAKRRASIRNDSTKAAILEHKKHM